jgi:hypothetical protein
MRNAYLVSGKIFEQRDGGIQKVNEFVLGLVVGVAAGVQCRVTGSVFAPLVFPVHHISMWYGEELDAETAEAYQNDSSWPW